MNCQQLKGSEIKEYSEMVEKSFGVVPFSKKDKVEICDIKNYKVLKSNDAFSFLVFDNFGSINIVPTLKMLYANPNFSLPKVTVDMGAIRFVTNGSDIMRPGITNVDSFSKDDFVVIVDETHGKVLAIGKAMFDSQEINKMEKGKVIKNISYVGDELWSIN